MIRIKISNISPVIILVKLNHNANLLNPWLEVNWTQAEISKYVKW